MPYVLEVEEELNKRFVKLAKRDKQTMSAVDKKVLEILENPYHFKPLRAPLQNKRRVHIAGSFVLIFDVDEESKTVRLLEFDRHDYAYE